MDNGSFIIHIKTEIFYEDIANDVEEWFDTSNYSKDDNRTLPIGWNKKIIGLFKDELGGKIMKEFVGFRAKTYAYLMDDNSEHKKAKGTKTSVIKRDLLLKNYKDFLFNDKIILKSQQRYKNLNQVFTTYLYGMKRISSMRKWDDKWNIND